MIYFVYGITDCPACLRACASLMEAELAFVFVNTDFSAVYREQLKKKYNHPTFPIIVRKTECDSLIIGGHDELLDHIEKVSLDTNFTCPI